jgi:sensor c-di-GMP phosphodiesterase-like protein
VDLQTGRWCGVEALLRWRRPNGELISPDIFIPIAERERLMERITDTVLGIVEREAGKLLHSLPEFHIALNLSADDFSRPDIVERLTSMIQRIRILPANLHVEATERVFLNFEACRRNLQQLRASGIKVAIDDFGTGYSSLSYLHNLEADCLKIDKTFVDTIGTQAVTSEVIRHIIEIARSVKMSMVAEGVETVAQADFLRAQEVQYGQGWLFAKPMPIEQLLQRLGLGRKPPTVPRQYTVLNLPPGSGQ